jgi:hypothetical protein
MTYHQQGLSTPDAEGHSPSAGPIAAAAALLSIHTRTCASYQSGYHTPYSTVSTRVQKHGKRELPVVSPIRRRENAADGRNQHQWPWQDLSTRFGRQPASLPLVVVGGIGP